MKKLTYFISLRRLSQSLIIILMLISPLSFSTDKVSNFTYECPVTAGCLIKDSRRSAVIHQTPENLHPAGIQQDARFDAACLLDPPASPFNSSPFSRAPPPLIFS